MANTIYRSTVEEYSAETVYPKWSVVKVTDSSVYFFVSLVAGEFGRLDMINFTSNQYWASFSDETFDFSTIWRPSYGTSIAMGSRVKRTAFEKGYEGRTADNINKVRMNANVSFKDLKSDEAKSLMSFLEYKGGKLPFYWTFPDPYDKKIRFTCKNFKNTYNNYEAMSVFAVFEEEFSSI